MSAESERAANERLAEQDAKDAREARPICQHCLADARYTRIGPITKRRCPVCGADYAGPRRSDEFAAIRDAGLLWSPARPEALR